MNIITTNQHEQEILYNGIPLTKKYVADLGLLVNFNSYPKAEIIRMVR